MTCNEMSFFPSNFMFQTPLEEPPSTIHPSCTPQHFHGHGTSFLGKRSMSLSHIEEMNGDDDLSDDGSQAGEKKRRLNLEQVRTLEKNFEMCNKLEPERKVQLAKALGLQPRQVAIWFQNRRARWKTKQLEKDYDILKRQFEATKADNEALISQNKKLHAEIVALKNREPTESINLNKETEASCSNRSENSSDINLDISRTQTTDNPALSPHPPKPLFSATSMRPVTFSQFLHSSPTPSNNLQCPKVEQTIQDENFCNIFYGVDDQSNFWPWQEQQQFH